MKKTSKPRGKLAQDMQSEYEFDYAKAKPNRFAAGSARIAWWYSSIPKCRRSLLILSQSMRPFVHLSRLCQRIRSGKLVIKRHTSVKLIPA